jgi:hypothetical protein
VRQSTACVVSLAVAVAALGVAAVALLYRPVPDRTHLQVERLDIVEPDGQVVMPLANTDRLPDPLIAGKTVGTDRTGPGAPAASASAWRSTPPDRRASSSSTSAARSSIAYPTPGKGGGAGRAHRTNPES